MNKFKILLVFVILCLSFNNCHAFNLNPPQKKKKVQQQTPTQQETQTQKENLEAEQQGVQQGVFENLKKLKKAKGKKKKKKFKKQKPQIPKMVETKQEWEVKAQSIPLVERVERKEEKTKEELKKEKKFYTPQPHYTFELYNYPPGSREVNISELKKNTVVHPIIVADKTCEQVAYVNYYYSADVNQVASDFFVEKLDTTKDKTKRILEYRHNKEIRQPKIKSGFDTVYQNLFNGLSVVDWSKDSKKVLVKERVGSAFGGNYMVYIYVYFLDKNKALKLETINKSLEDYFYNKENLHLRKFRYDIEPLGFTYDNDNLIALKLYVISKEGERIFLGTWGYDLEKNNTILLSKDGSNVSISSNGLVLKQVLE